MKPLLIIISILILLVFLIWLGLQIRPQSFPSFVSNFSETETFPIPENLPAPVERFYRQVYGENIPVIDSAVFSGVARLRVKGITMPSRFRFTHLSGQEYRHYIESTFYGIPFLSVNEHFLKGKAKLELPFGISEGSQIDQAANLALWAEAVMMPSIWLTNPRVSWEARDENSAILTIPLVQFATGSTTEVEQFTVFFDSETGFLKSLQSMRYKSEESETKTLWVNEVVRWGIVDGYMLPIESSVTWEDEGTPWAIFTLEEIVYNADVSQYVQKNGIEQ